MIKKKVAIIGAGLAGCSIAYELSRVEEFDVTIFDKNSQVANDASGNFAGILAPSLTSDNNFSDQFHTLGYNLLLEFINQYKKELEICNQGVIQILKDDKDLQRYTKIFNKRVIPSDLAQFLSAEEVSKLINTSVDNQAIYYPNALSLVPKKLCQLWIQLSKVKLSLNSELRKLIRDEYNNWQLEFVDFRERFDIVILTGGYELFKKIDYLNKIPVYPSQGQLTVIEQGLDIKHTIMNKGYIIPRYKNSLQVIGATFRDNSDTQGDIRDKENQFNLSQIQKMLPTLSNMDMNIVDSRVATRCVTSDHLPLIGKLVDYNSFEDAFYKPLSKGYPRAKMPNIEYEEKLYLSSGFGSKGLSSSLIAAKIICADILNQKNIISNELAKSLSPQRFWIRGFRKSYKFSDI